MNFVLQYELVKNAKIFTYGTSEVAFTKFFEILAQVLNKNVPKETKKSTKRPKNVGWIIRLKNVSARKSYIRNTFTVKHKKNG